MIAFLSTHGQIVMATCLLYGLLALASLGVTVGTRARPGSQLRLQVNAWWMIFPVVSVSLVAYPVGPAALVLGIGMLAARELAPHAAQPRSMLAAFMALLAALAVLAWLWPPLGIALAALAAAMAIVWYSLAGTRTGLLLAAFAVTMGGLGCVVALMDLPLAPPILLAWLFYLFVLTALNDIGQFVFGTLFGKQKIAPGISPNKTWQGLGGGLLASVLVSLVLGDYLRLAASQRWLTTVGLLLSVGGFCGDLAYSALKRRLGIKDFSQLIPGHGGILDRVDSLVLTAPLLYCVLRYTINQEIGYL